MTDTVERDLPPVQGGAVAVTPMDMLARAIERNMDPVTLKQLMDLADRFNAGEARKAFVIGLNAFKSDPPAIFKNKQVSFGTNKTAYKHATLDNVSGVIGAALAKVGISHRWETEQLEGGMVRVTCVLTHVLGHSERVPLQASPDQSGSKNSIQAVGSTVTYLQRYTLLAATGMAVQDQDDDGRQGKGNAMADNVKADFLAAVDMVEMPEQWDKLWAQILAASTAAGDIAAHEELRAAMAKRKREMLKKGAK